jgi:hypothetical protein
MVKIICILNLIFLTQVNANDLSKSMQIIDNSSKPYTRYWWFASQIQKDDVRYNLDWLKDNGFGGVEIAWVYPLNRLIQGDTSYTPRQEWLSPEWRDIVDFTIKYADSIGLVCDLTFGTLWPFGDTFVRFEEASQRFGEPDWRQEIKASWQYPKVGYVVDHITPRHYLPYFKRIIDSYPRPIVSLPQSYFIDSWEVRTDKLWSDSFKDDFIHKFGYDITEYMDSIYAPKFSENLYDYMSLISEKVLKFYSDFDSSLNHNGILSRGQVAGAPCDIISGYSLVDIPEGEALLYEPEYNSIPASACALSGRKTVTAESFTCLYGWPRDYMLEEQSADIKLIADALFANGVNHIIWHGKPHNPKNSDSVKFYATTHVGPSSHFADELPKLNQYLEKVSRFMKKGNKYSQVAVYLPTEDAWTNGYLPEELRMRWSWGYYEMRYIYFPEETKGFSPIWINSDFLSRGTVEKGKFKVANMEFDQLYIDVNYLDIKALKTIYNLAKSGLNVILKKSPKQSGSKKDKMFNNILNELQSLDNVSEKIKSNPLIDAEKIPEYWAKIEGNDLYIFFSNPKSKGLKFPLDYGQSYNVKTDTVDILINYWNKSTPIKLVFKPYQSLLLKISPDKYEFIDIEYIPKEPVIKARPKDFKAPWKL